MKCVQLRKLLQQNLFKESRKKWLNVKVEIKERKLSKKMLKNGTWCFENNY